MNSPIITSEVSIPVENAVKSSVELYKSLSSHPQLREHFSEAFFMFLIDLNKHVLVGDWGYTNEEHIPLYAKISVAHRRILDYFCENNGIGSEFWTIIDEAASYLLRRYISPLLGEYKTFFAETYTRLSAINAKRDGSTCGIPKELMRIINSRLDYGDKDIFNSPFSGGIGSLIETPENLSGEVGVRNVEDEILTLLAAEVFELSLNVNRYESIEFALYELNRSETCKANKIFLFPPLGLKVETDNGKTFSEVLALEAAFQKLEQGEDTKIAIVTSSAILFRGDKRSIDIRQKLVTSGFIESVTQLPPNLLESTAIPLVQIVLSQLGANRTDDSLPAIRFIDASSFTEKGKLDVENVFKVFNEPPIKGISTDYNFSKDEVDFDLSVIRKTAYIEPLRIEKGYTERTLEDVSQLIKSTTTKLDIGKWVNSSNFPKNGRETSFADLEVIEMTQPRRCEVNTDALLVSAIPSGDSIAVASFKYAGESIYVGRSILVLSVKNSIILPEWLAWMLRSERLQTQMMTLLSGAAINRLQWSSLKEITLAIPSIEMQQVEISKKEKEFDRLRAKEAGLEVYTNRIKQGYLDSLSITKHNLIDALSIVKPKLNLLHKILKRDGQLNAGEMIGGSTILDYVKSVHDGLLTLGDIIHDLGDHEILKTKGSVNLIKSLRSLSKELSSERLEIEINFFQERNAKNGISLSYHKELLKREDLYVGVDEANFQLMIRQIAKNAVDHGGKPQVKLDFVITITKEDKISLLCANNGEVFVPSMTLKKFVTNGLTLGKTGNTGKGGYILNEIMQSAHGEVRIHNLKHIAETPDEYCLIDHCERAKAIAMSHPYEEVNTGIELIFPIIEA